MKFAISKIPLPNFMTLQTLDHMAWDMDMIV